MSGILPLSTIAICVLNPRRRSSRIKAMAERNLVKRDWRFAHALLVLDIAGQTFEEKVEIAIHNDVGRHPNPRQRTLAFDQKLVQSLERHASLGEGPLVYRRKYVARPD